MTTIPLYQKKDLTTSKLLEHLLVIAAAPAKELKGYLSNRPEIRQTLASWAALVVYPMGLWRILDILRLVQGDFPDWIVINMSIHVHSWWVTQKQHIEEVQFNRGWLKTSIVHSVLGGRKKEWLKCPCVSKLGVENSMGFLLWMKHIPFGGSENSKHILWSYESYT